MIPYLILLAAIAAGVCLFFWMRFIEPRRLKVTRLVYRHPRLPDALDGKRIAAFSDLHLEGDTPSALTRQLIRKVNEEDPWMLFFLGDVFDNYPAYKAYLDGSAKDGAAPDPVESASGIFGAMHAQVLKAAVLGNHDYEVSALPEVEKLLNDSGFLLLREQAVACGGIGVAGTDDYIQGEPEDGVPGIPGAVRILLCHEPDAALLFPGDFCDLMLSGHTHNGQIRIPFLRKCYHPRRGKNFDAGAYRLEGSMRLYVCRGIGCSLMPLRFFASPEILSIRLEKGPRVRLVREYRGRDKDRHPASAEPERP